MKNEKTYWKNWYIGVIAFLLIQVIFYYFITTLYK